jgi:hypothetical protein
MPAASITWRRPDGTAGLHILREKLPAFSSYDEAAGAALEAAKKWVDRKLSGWD